MQKEKIKIQGNKGILDFLNGTDKRKIFLLGGAGSGKSWAIAQHLILNKILKESDIRILVTRKTLPSLKASAYQLMCDMMIKYKIPNVLNKSDMIMQVGDSKILFKGLDDPEKIKSLDVNYVWGEEATDFNHSDYLQLNLRTRRKNKNGINQLFFSFNPIDEQNYLHNIVEAPGNDIAVHRSTYLDNAFLDKEYIQELTGLGKSDETYYKIYTLGQWATPTNIIYTNYDIISEFPESFDEIIYGLDFGYNNPTALVEIGYKDQEVYERGLLYESKLTNDDLIQKLKELIKNKNAYIFADCAEPNRIEEIRREGFNVHPSDKSVKDGIDYVKRQTIHIFGESEELIKEKRGYKWKEDKNENILDEPVKFNDHYMDAERYAIYTYKKQPEPTIMFIK